MSEYTRGWVMILAFIGLVCLVLGMAGCGGPSKLEPISFCEGGMVCIPV